MPPRILVVDDEYAAEEPAAPERLARGGFVAAYGDDRAEFEFCTAWDAYAGTYTRSAVESVVFRSPPDLILLDIMFGRQLRLGLEILGHLTRELPGIPVVMISSLAKAEALDEALGLGAVDYLPKPFPREELWVTADRYLHAAPEHWLVGLDPGFLATVTSAALAAEGGSSSVLLLGETGTGKELFARYVHRHGRRRDRPFVGLDPNALPEGLLEGALFGYSKGAFTGADRDSPGAFVEADGGTLFLDEIGNLPAHLQAKLLRALEAREVRRLGDGRTTRFDVQVVAASHEPLPLRVKEGRFRADLYHRLATTQLQIPSLANRPGDVHLLFFQLVRRCYLARGMDDGLSLPRDYPPLPAVRFDGNVRELWNLIQRAFDAARGRVPNAAHVAAVLGARGSSSPPGADGPGAGVEVLAADVLRDPDAFVAGLRLAEFRLLVTALEDTKHPVTGKYNRAAALGRLSAGRPGTTTLFDRRLRALWDELPGDAREPLLVRYPQLGSIPGIRP